MRIDTKPWESPFEAWVFGQPDLETRAVGARLLNRLGDEGTARLGVKGYKAVIGRHFIGGAILEFFIDLKRAPRFKEAAFSEVTMLISLTPDDCADVEIRFTATGKEYKTIRGMPLEDLATLGDKMAPFPHLDPAWEKRRPCRFLQMFHYVKCGESRRLVSRR